jgi:hypothetical protein
MLTCTEVQYAIFCRTLERCLKMLQKIIVCLKSFINPLYDSMCLLYCGVPLPETEIMIG